MISRTSAERVLNAALTTGGDFAELYMEDGESHSISMLDGVVENAAYSRARGAGVRILSGTRSAYAYTVDISESALVETAKRASAIIKGEGGGVLPFTDIRDGNYRCRIPFSAVDNARRVHLLKLGTDAAKAESGEITKVSAAYMDTDKKVLVCNTEGVWAEDRRPRTRLAFTAVASDGMEFQTGQEIPAFGMGFEAYELATSVARGNSEFCGKLGQKIASDIVTAIDDGTLPGEWGSIRYDDEGNPSQCNVLIQNGMLKSYLVDRLGSRIMNQPMTGSARRQSYEFAPTSRMTNTFFAPGYDDEEEMIRTMGEGLFAAKMGGGSVNPLTGEFNFSVLEGYWVKDGKIHCPVRGAALIGRGAEVLMKIDRIGMNMWFGHGMCGSRSGSVPTNVGQPRIRVSGITVGGKGGRL